MSMGGAPRLNATYSIKPDRLLIYGDFYDRKKFYNDAPVSATAFS